MDMRTLSAVCLAAILAVPVSVAPALALNPKSFVSSTGNNANSCATEAAPCRTLSGALAKTNPKGSIYCLDHGEFSGGVQTTIAKSITIDCAGTGASIYAGSNALFISAAATDRIHIRGLKIVSSGFSAIVINGTGAAASVRVEACDLMTVANAAVMAVGGSTSAGTLELFIANTTISNGITGLNFSPSSGAVKATLDNVRIFNNNNYGILAAGDLATASGIQVVVTNSTITGNGTAGIWALSSGGPTQVLVKDSMVDQNGVNGIKVESIAVVSVSGSTITQNAVGLVANFGGTLNSYGNNQINGNLTSNGAFTATLPLH
jgi:hypothetical protein